MLRTLTRLAPYSSIESFEHFVLGNYQRTKKFLNMVNPDLLEEISKKKALFMFRLAAKETPAYQKFLKLNKFDPKRVRSINEFNQILPQTDKANYIKKYSFEQRCREGHLPYQGNIDESGGTSGKATNWIHDVGEEELLAKAISFEYNYVFEGDKKNFIVISAWSTGPWATGIKFCELMERVALVKNTDTNPKEVMETLQMFGKNKNYMIGGYPPFIKNMLDDNKDKINWKDYNIDLVTGGEGVPIEWVYYVKKLLKHGSKIVSSYGCSDIDIGIGFETPLAFFFRELTNENEKLRAELFGKDDLPMIFQYNPTVHYIREVPNQEGKTEIEITLLDRKAALTKIKYNLHDEGKRYSYHDLIKKIETYHPGWCQEYEKRGGKLKEILHLPFLCIFGRSDGTLSFDGANVFPDQIEAGILKDKKLSSITHRFKMEKKYDKHHTMQFHIHIEMKPGCIPQDKLKSAYLKSILGELLKLNPDFRESYSKNKTVQPWINLYKFDHPLFKQDDLKSKNIYFTKKKPQIKNKS
ncbi:MAG: hypothetical protein WCV90_02520 [Candidatus Woesearchaeota archaeon]|jgi:phenylacetate-CoA ligase